MFEEPLVERLAEKEGSSAFGLGEAASNKARSSSPFSRVRLICEVLERVPDRVVKSLPLSSPGLDSVDRKGVHAILEFLEAMGDDRRR